MLYLAAILQSTVSLALDVLMFMMFARAVTSWFPSLSESSIGEFLYTFTEWIILPIRSLFDALGWNNGMMIDIPFFVTFMLLSIVSSIL